MLVKAQVSFSGALCMHMGETREIADDAVAKDLIRAGYIVEVKTGKAKAKAAAPVAPAEEVAEPETPAEEVAEPETKETSKKGK